jgi:GPH family glycoside/pentoside/hexuronide:cation symporter
MTDRAREDVGVAEKIAYALGDTASNFYWKTFEVFALFYYTDVFGLSAAQVGFMFFVTRVCDAVADPVMGALADRTTTRFGKFRPYLLWLALPMAFTGVLTFTRPPLHGAGLLAYAYATYTAMMLAYTAVNIPYSALLGVLTPSSRARTSCSSFRFVGAFAGGLLVQTFTLSFVHRLGRGDDARGWRDIMLVYGALACAMFVAAFAWTRERVKPPVGHRADLRGELLVLARSRPWRVLLGVGLLVIVSFWLRGGATTYYFKYLCRREDLIGWFFGAASVAQILGAAVASPLTRLLGKRRLYAVVLAVAGALTTVFFVVDPHDLPVVFGLNVLVALILGPQAPVLWAMFADVADHVEWKTGRRMTGLVFAAAIFSMKVGGALGGWALGQMLDRFGYVPNAEQSESSQQGILLAMSVLPGVVCVVAAAVVWSYELDEKEVATVEQALAERRGGGPQQEAVAQSSE